MAVTYAATTTLPAQDVVTLSATAGKVTQITIPTGVKVSLYARTSAGKLVLGDDVAQTDDVDLGAADYATLPADQWVPLNFRQGSTGMQARTVFYLASASASQVIEIMLEDGANA